MGLWNKIKNAGCLQCSGKFSWGWVVCLSFLGLFTLAAGVAFSYGEVMIPLNKEVHGSLTLLSWMGTLPVSLPMLAAPVATWLNFKFGTRQTVFAGVFVSTMALAITAMVNSIVLMFLVYGIMGGIGLLLVVNPPFFLLDDYFPYHHPRHVLATSLIACGFPLATLIFNPVTYAMLEAVGWRITYSIFSIVMFLFGSAAAATFRPKAGGLSLSSQPILEADEYDEIPEPNELPIATKTKWIMGLLWLVASTLKSMGYYTPFVTLVKQMEVMGIPQSQSSKAMAVVGACEVVSRVITSWIGDYIKGKILYVYVVCTLVLCLQNALGSLASTFNHLLIYAAILGIFGGPIIAAMYSSCSEVLDNKEVPMLFSVFRVGLGLGGLIGPTVAGAIFDATRTFHNVFYLNSSTYAITSCIYMLIIYMAHKRPKWCYPDLVEEVPLVASQVTNGAVIPLQRTFNAAENDQEGKHLAGGKNLQTQSRLHQSYQKGYELDSVSVSGDSESDKGIYSYDQE